MTPGHSQGILWHQLKPCPTSLALTLPLAAAVASLPLAIPARAQSSRPGWGATPYQDASGSGVTFRVWAPNAASVYVPGQFNNWSTTATPLAKEETNGVWGGIWSADVSGATAGQQYKYYINSPSGGFWKHDPRARLVTYSGDASGANDIIYDSHAFNWANDLAPAPSLNGLFIYELHIGTFYTVGSTNKFLDATNKLDYLKNLGVNAVEVMPIAEFPGDSSWGYNPAQIFAVENDGYGGPDGFKTFVRACHQRGLAVLLDVVHNHYGPDDLDMWNFDGWSGAGPIGGGIYFYESNTNLQITPYGDTRPNFASQQVSNFISDNFAMWLNDCHVDGFRWDTPNLMMNAANYGYIPAAGELLASINAMIHTNGGGAGKISIAEDVYTSFGFDAAWDTSFPYAVTPVLTNTLDAGRDIYTISDAIQSNVRYGGTAGFGRVAFLESHDVVGDLNNGERLVTAIDAAAPSSWRARKLSTLGAAIAACAPGIPMIFQGQEMLENQAFDSSLPVDWSKTVTYTNVVRFYHDLIAARRDLKGYTPGLEGDRCALLAVDNINKVVAFHRWKSAATNQDAVVIANFSGSALTNHSVPFPSPGTWYLHLNSDSTNYGADYRNVGGPAVIAAGSSPTASVTIGPYSVLILSPTPDAAPQLTITPVAAGALLSWPASYAEWIVAASPSLPAAAWQPLDPAQYQTNGPIVSLSIPASSSAAFYRLQRGS